MSPQSRRLLIFSPTRMKGFQELPDEESSRWTIFWISVHVRTLVCTYIESPIHAMLNREYRFQCANSLKEWREMQNKA